jgi:hypothetical protein
LSAKYKQLKPVQKFLLSVLGIALAATTGGGAMMLTSGHRGVREVVESVVDHIPGLPKVSVGGTNSAGAASVSPEAAMAALNKLQVAPRVSLKGYTRGQFGEAWTDDNGVQWGHNGCSTREDILHRDLTNILAKGCKIQSGVLHDPYTGKTIQFQRGPQTSAEVQIDHVVPLAAAWRTGAQKLSPAQRVNLANDPLNLLAVDGPTNQSKGAGDASEWLPPNAGFRCAYVTRQIQVKTRYRLWVTMGEKAAMGRVLSRCRS